MPRRASSRVASSPWSNRREEATMETFNMDYRLTMPTNPKRNSFIGTTAGLRVTSSGRTVIVQIKGYLFFLYIQTTDKATGPFFSGRTTHRKV
jgi:hypothetical protein